MAQLTESGFLEKAKVGRYVGLAEEVDDFKERFTALQAEFAEQLQEEKRLNGVIAEKLAKVIV
jgi:type I restriction enzyme M protein